MKKAITLLLAAMMIITLAACGSQSASVHSTPPAEMPKAETPAQTDQTVEAVQQETTDTAKKILVLYFTPANNDTVDAISSATPRVGDAASVEYISQLISAQTGADMAKITAVDAYPLPYRDAADFARKEQDNDVRPAFTVDADPEDYDVIFFGYPIWWYHLPMIVRNFFESYELSEKTIIPFVLHGGSRDGGTFNEIRELEPAATVLDGLAVAGDRADRAQNDVSEWLARLSY